MSSSAAVVTGRSGGDGAFRVHDSAERGLGPVEDVLRGRRLGAVLRGYAAQDEVAEILARFRASPAVRRRDTEAPSEYLGAYHYHKPPARYLAESAEVAGEVARVLEFEGSPWRRFWSHLDEHLADAGVTLRPATLDGADSCRGLVRTWVSDGEFALVPHEDAAQCRDPRQDGFEIGAAADGICAVNLCLANGGGGGLLIWNVVPDDATRARFGTTVDGGPYPPAALQAHRRLRLDVRPGDLYIFNSGHIHAVERHEEFRATAASLLGFVDEKTVVRWT
ncbi:hypothetical protein ABZ570_07640 [Micromonospora sp. NPDC007271]|uniref:hypothetical protein n=1 Tax=Micromonospora sp. NPDC007271 TaxID=3154587 RepID=UPI00340B9D04